jgi:hypothetical protein
MSVKNMLAEHGTQLMSLKPSSLLHTAAADLARRKRNSAPLDGGYEHYAFHRKHVKKANTAAELVSLAAAEPGVGLASAKYNTRLIYGDTDLLLAARELADV